jgi:hypothetical protein
LSGGGRAGNKIDSYMSWLRRLLRPRGAGDGLARWREAWSEVAARPGGVDADAVRDLRARLDRLNASDDDLEIEREMIEGLEQLLQFASTVAEQGLPAIGTGHRVVGTDICHFSAPVSMPDDPSQPSGRLLLTHTRAVFVGGARGVTVPWHAVTRVLHSDRDVVLVRVDSESLYRFRCNSFEDVLRAVFIAQRLATKRDGNRRRGEKQKDL